MKQLKALRLFTALTLLITQGDFQVSYALSQMVEEPVLVKVEAAHKADSHLFSSFRGLFTQMGEFLSQDRANFKGLSGQIKVTLANGDYYVINPERARVLEMGVREEKEGKRDFLRYTVDYLYDESHNELIRVRTLSSDPQALETYEIYARTKEGKLLGLLETGVHVQGMWIPGRKYDRTQRLVTVYDFWNPSARATYTLETADSNEPHRLIRYEDQIEGEPLELEIRYDDRLHTQTVLNLRKQSYEVYELLPGNETGRLLELGQVEPGSQGLQFKERQLVELFNLQRQGGSLPAYVFTREEDPDYLAAFERLPQGGLGRLLWYRGNDPEGRPIDQEFYYEQDEKTGEETVIVLDHIKASYLRFILAQGRAEEGVIDPVEKERNRDESGLSGIVNQGKKMEMEKRSVLFNPETKDAFIPSNQEKPKFREKWEPWVRGPPQQDSGISSSPHRGFAVLAETLLSEFNSSLLLNSLAVSVSGKGCLLTGLIKANQKATQSKGGF